MADVIHLLESVVGEPVALVGQSLGGHTALLVASARPDLVDRLVLLEAGVGGDGTAESRAGMRQFFDSWPTPFADRSEAELFLGDSALSRAWIDDLERRPDGLWRRFDADIMIATIEPVDARARWDEWTTVAVPTLAVFGRDGMFDTVAKHEFLRRGRRVQHVDLAAGGHDAHLEAHDLWVAALTAFLDGPAGSSATVRPYESADAAGTLAVFLDAVTVTAAGDYSPDQIAAWSAPQERDVAEWDLVRSRLGTVVATVDGEVAGFSDVDDQGYIDMMFVASRFGRRGVAGALLREVERRAGELTVPALWTNASITARPFFERHGFVVVSEQHPVIRGALMRNCRMRKELAV
ncbi:Alpha/beta hydrolase [Cryobacterium arcticum]|uniref:Alpha/beta hydrolase n=1 Tax=Cryobacterium arcticum TaxID=670052 RepID=A0A1B1BNV3_9MICO|nr:Alpha/beta hydrolase [Cryobacterium arcticum]